MAFKPSETAGAVAASKDQCLTASAFRSDVLYTSTGYSGAGGYMIASILPLPAEHCAVSRPRRLAIAITYVMNLSDGSRTPQAVNAAYTRKIRPLHNGAIHMAQKIQTLFIDDIDGGEAEGTVRFALDGTEYEIDLSAKHDEELRAALGTYVAHARKVSGSTRKANAARSSRKPSLVDTVAVRAWARENGHDIKDRGRVPAGLVAKYREAVG
jgi:hypothetical protein